MEIHGTKEYFYKGERSNSHRIGLKHQHGRRFTVLGQEYARRKVMRKCSISIISIYTLSDLGNSSNLIG